MRWTNEHDFTFLREAWVYEPWKHKYGSLERRKVWGKIAESLNDLNTVCEFYFKVTNDLYETGIRTTLRTENYIELQRTTLLWPA